MPTRRRSCELTEKGISLRRANYDRYQKDSQTHRQTRWQAAAHMHIKYLTFILWQYWVRRTNIIFICKIHTHPQGDGCWRVLACVCEDLIYYQLLQNISASAVIVISQQMALRRRVCQTNSVCVMYL